MHRSASRAPLGMALVAVAGLFGLALRCFSVGETPVWLDEIFSFLLVRQGPGVIIANSLNDPHPPGWYLLFWFSTGLGEWRSEWGLRWLGVLAGSLTVFLVMMMAVRYAGLLAVGCAGLALAVSPLHLYFSQEARPPVIMGLVAAAAVLAMERVIARPDDRRALGVLILCNLFGLYLGYFFVLVSGVQVLTLMALRRWRAALVYAAALSLLGLPVAYFFLQSVPNVAQVHSQHMVHPVEFAQALVGGEPVRFGFGWWHPTLLALLGVAGLAGVVAARGNSALAYHSAQVILPLAGFWLILVELLGMSLPLSEAKQFLVLLPSLFVLAAAGLHLAINRLPRPAGYALMALFCTLALTASLASAGRAWQVGKTADGLLLKELLVVRQPGDAVIFSTYIMAYPFIFYRPADPIYFYPAFDGSPYPLMLRQSSDPPGAALPVTRQTILVHSRVLMIKDNRWPNPAIDWLGAQCKTRHAGSREPFELLIFEDCRP